MARDVEILGFTGDRRAAPLVASEIWGLNQLYQEMTEVPWTRWFEIHDLDFLKGWNPEYVEWLRGLTIPVYMQKHHEEIPSSIAFPRDEVNHDLGERFGFSFDYFTSSFSYMVALALYEGFNAIGLYGVSFILDGEATYERPGLEYLVGIAQGAGVDVTIGPASQLLRINYVYGYKEPRMRLSDVQPVIDYLGYSEATARENVNSLDEALTKYPPLKKGTPKERVEREKFRREVITRLIENQAQRRLLGDLGWWLKHYGRGGNLIAPDGTLNK